VARFPTGHFAPTSRFGTPADFMYLRFSEWRGNVTDKDPPEKPQEKRRHLVDCLAYVLLDRSRFVDRGPRVTSWTPIHPAVGY
jgi:hypothetical protein